MVKSVTGKVDRVLLSRTAHRHTAGRPRRSHGSDVIEPVYELLEHVIARRGPVPVVLERDNDVPPLDDLLAERRRIDAAYRRGLARFDAGAQPEART